VLKAFDSCPYSAGDIAAGKTLDTNMIAIVRLGMVLTLSPCDSRIGRTARESIAIGTPLTNRMLI